MNIPRIISASLLAIATTLLFVTAAEGAGGWYVSGAEESVGIRVGDAGYIDKHGFCRYVSNDSTEGELFVPVKTAAEWRSFRGYNPDGSGLAVCCGYETVNECGGGNPLNAVGIEGQTVTGSFGYSKTITFRCEVSGVEPDAVGHWVRVAGSEVGDCEVPSPSQAGSGEEWSEGQDSNSGGCGCGGEGDHSESGDTGCSGQP